MAGVHGALLGWKNQRDADSVAYHPRPANDDVQRVAKRSRMELWILRQPVRWGVICGAYFGLLLLFWAWKISPHHAWPIHALAAVVCGSFIGLVSWLAGHIRRARLLKQS